MGIAKKLFSYQWIVKTKLITSKPINTDK